MKLMARKNKGPRIIKRKETDYERKESFGKRSKGLLKKAFELSVLCDIDVALIMYSPNNKLRHFSGYKKPERILQDYIQSLATNPENKEERRPVISQDTIDKINICVSQADIVNQQGLEAPEREEINEEIRQYQNKLVLLQDQAKKLCPNQGISNSIQESMERKRYLGEVLYKIMERKNQLLSRFNIRSCTTILPPNMQGQQVQLGDPIGMGAPFVLPQAGNGKVQQQLQNFPTWIPPQGGEQVRLPGVLLNSGKQMLLSTSLCNPCQSTPMPPPTCGKQMVKQEAPLEVDPSLPTFDVQLWRDWEQYEADLKGHQYPPMAHDHEASGSQSQVFEQTVHSQQIPMQQPQTGEQVQLPGVSLYGMGYPFSSSSSVPLNTGEQTVHSQQIPVQQPEAGDQVQLGYTDDMACIMNQDYQEYMASLRR